MAHLIENMFSVKETPWHKLGVIVQDAPNAEEAIKIAGLSWNVIEQPLYRNTVEAKSQNSLNPVKVASHKALIRDRDDSVLGVVGKNYHPLQNHEAFNFFNPFIESGLASFETAGSLQKGKLVWILAKLNKAPIEVGQGDEVNKFLLLSNSHDGTMSVRTGFTPIRVVCANTLAMAVSNKGSQLLRVHHSKSVKANLDRVQEIINAADAKFEATAEQYRSLARKDINQNDLKKYVQTVFEVHKQPHERQAQFESKMVETITKLFETGRGTNLKSANGTLWGLYNSVTEYLSYEAGRSDDSRLNTLWFGRNKTVNEKALNQALEMVGA